jgi:phage-related protein (TIGR01555 family)
MGMWDRLFDWVSSRSDASPQLPTLAGPVELDQRREDSTFNPFTMLGGPRDKGAIARPSLFNLALSDLELTAAHRDSGIARRIVEVLPNEATRKGWSVPEVPAAAESDLQLYERVCEAGKMAQLYGDSIVLMVTEDDIPPRFRSRPELWLEQPLDPERVGSIRALQLFDTIEGRPAEWERDVREPGYRLPKIWSIGADGFTARVHASRVLLLRGANRPPSQTRWSWGRSSSMPDDSILQAIWNEIRHLTEVHQGGAVLAQELSVSVLKIEKLPQKQGSDEASAFQTLLKRFVQSLGLLNAIILGPNDSYEKKSTPATGFSDLSEAAQAMLATVLGWPRSMLSGEAPGGLSTDDQSGLERERKIVSTYQEQRLRRPLEQFYRVLYASQDGPTGGETPDEWSLVFHPLNEPSDKEIADLRLVVMQTDVGYINAGVYGPEVVAEQRFGAEGFEIELKDVPIPDPDEEAAIEAARQALEGGNVATDPARGDAIADDSVCLLVPASDTGLRAAVERAIGQTLNAETEPHVTILFLGTGIDQVDEVIQIAGEEVGRAIGGTLANGSVRAFPAGADGVPIVVEFSDTWAAQQLHDTLLTRLAHLVTQKQYRVYRPHVTIGYAPQPLSVEAVGALGGIDASAVRVPIAAVAVTVGKETKALIPTGGS